MTFQEQLDNTTNVRGIDATAGAAASRTILEFRNRLEQLMAGQVRNNSIVESVMGRVEEHLIDVARLVTAEFR